MKKILLLFFVNFLITFTALAQAGQTGHLTVISEDYAPFTLFVNNQKMNVRPAIGVRVEHINRKTVNIRIEFDRRTGKQNLDFRAVSLADENGYMQDITYAVSADRRTGAKLSVYSVFPMAPLDIRGEEIEVHDFKNPRGTRRGDDDWRRYYNNPRQNKYRNNRDRRNDYTVVGPHTSDCPLLSAREFSEVRNAIKNSSFDDERLSTAKVILNSSCMTSDQIAELTALFSFESNRLEFAKFAYSYCTDQHNYFRVGEKLSFSSSRTELNDFILQQGRR